MVLRTITAINDTITSEESPSTNYTRRPTLTLRETSGARTFGYISMRGLRSDPQAQVNSAVLRLHAAETAASSTFTVRRVLGQWESAQLRWNNQPSGTGAVVDTQTTALTLNQPVDFDVTEEVARWLVSGAPNYGLRLHSTDTGRSGRSFHAVNATGTFAAYRPVLLLDVSYPPERPDSISPADGGTVSTSGPMLTWRYAGLDVAPMVAYQVQMNPNNVWTAPATDTGEVASDTPQHQLSGLTGDVLWYRIRHKSAEDRWSPWSDGRSIRYAAPATVTITSTEATTGDPTPTTTWTVAGGVQTAFQVILSEVDSGRVRADSGVVVGADTQWAPASALGVAASVELRREVRAWTADEFVASVGQPAYAFDTFAPFTITPGTTTTPVSGLTVTNPIGPAIDVVWTRSSTPDSFIVERSIDEGPWRQFEVEAGDVAVGGSSYAWRDVTAPAERDATYRVRAVVNRSMSTADDEATIRVRPNMVWLANEDDPSWLLPILESDPIDWGVMAEQSTVLEPRGSDRVNIVHQASRGYAGTVEGKLFSDVTGTGGASARDLWDRFMEVKRNPTHVWRLIGQDQNIPVVLREATISVRRGPEISYLVRFEYYQQGELPWLEGA